MKCNVRKTRERRRMFVHFVALLCFVARLQLQIVVQFVSLVLDFSFHTLKYKFLFLFFFFIYIISLSVFIRL